MKKNEFTLRKSAFITLFYVYAPRTEEMLFRRREKKTINIVTTYAQQQQLYYKKLSITHLVLRLYYSR